MRPLKRKRNFALAVILISLTILSTSCRSLPEERTDPIKIEWPTPPHPAGQVWVKDGMVYMPLDYWLQLIEYIVDVDAIRQKIEIIE